MVETRPKTEPDELTGLKSLGKRITRRTFDLTAFAIVAIGLITIAFRLSSWWQVHDGDPAAGAGIPPQSQLPWGLGEDGAWLSFGDAAWSARHLTLMGTAEAVRERMVANCTDRLAEFDSLSMLPAPTPEEERLIGRLGELAPVTEQADEAWRVYALDGPLLAVFGVMSDDSHDRATSTSRIVCWGLALPAGMVSLAPPESETTENQQPLWSAWMIDAAGSAPSGSEHGPTIPAPLGADRVLSIRDPHAGGIDTFRGPGSLNEWQRHFAEWLRGQGAEEFEWSSQPHNARTSVVIKHAEELWRCDVLLAELPQSDEIECVVNLVQVAIQP